MKSQSKSTHTQHTSGITAIEPQTHELGANLIFTAHDLKPYYGLDSVIKKYDGATTDTIRYGDSRYEVTVSYSKSNLKPWDNPNFELETVREFDIKIRPVAEDKILSGLISRPMVQTSVSIRIFLSYRLSLITLD